MTLDAATVLAASASSIYVPDNAVRIDADGYVMVRYEPEFVYNIGVHRIDSDRAPADLVEEADAQARAWGRDTVWWHGLRDGTRPAGLEPLLIERGGTLVERLAVLALDLTKPLPELDVPDDVEVVRPTTAQHMVDKHAIHDEAFGSVTARTTTFEERLTTEVARREAGEGDGVLVYVGGEPASFGGSTYSRGVAQLWGGSTRQRFRGQGAYRAALDARLRAAAAAGCTMALVQGRVATSAPTLLRSGFVAFGEERVYRIDAAGTSP